MQHGRVTSRDVAREAGVSQTTVSFVLNGNTERGIAEKTRRKVLATAQRLGYVPSGAARSLITGRSSVVLCVVPDFPVTQAMNGLKVELSRVLGDAGLSCVFLHTAGSDRPLAELWPHLDPSVVVCFGELDPHDLHSLERAGIAVVDGLFSPEGSRLTGVEQEGIGRLQVGHLAGRGHRRIGYATVTDPRESRFFTPRLAGVTEACSANDLPAPTSGWRTYLWRARRSP